ncbi:FAD-dependent oxidoreductase [Pannus brasiliensis CCIBt3594]|uniref:FAD-dependent oxidoreductase n=1 Tax=Pannus brasiliensis CCIBt3594 TaxID=1427578 RepID=A0AAW9QHF3_9CHRO
MEKIAIIGGGVIGASIAYELGKIQGLEISLFEEKTPGQGSTGAALGIMMGAISHKTKGRGWKLRQKSLERYETLIPELESVTGIRIPFNRQGIVMFRFTDEDTESWQNLAGIRQRQGLELEIWDRQKLRENCPEITDDRVTGAIYSRFDRQVNPTILTRALVEGAARNGVNCHFGVKVENFEFDAVNDSNTHHCKAIHTEIGTFEIDRLILCAGIGSFELTRQLTRPVEIRPVIGQALQVKLPRDLGRKDFQPVLTGDDIHIVPLGNGEYWIGATVEFTELEEAELLEEVRQKAIEFCPELANGEIVRTWSGKRPRPEGKPAPVIEKLDGYDNVILATGHYRNGVLLAPATAQIVREAIETGK